MVILHQTQASWNRDERNRINENWQRIAESFLSIQRQIYVLAGDQEVEDLLARIEQALQDAETEVSNYIALIDANVEESIQANNLATNEALGKVTTALGNMEVLISEAQRVIEVANTAKTGAETAAGNAIAAAQSANTAAQKAKDATTNATQKAEEAQTATTAANQATNAANTATEGAVAATKAASDAAKEANYWAHEAENQLQDVRIATEHVTEAAKSVEGWTGAAPWDTTTQWQTRNVVTFNGSTWQAKRQNKGAQPAEGDDWILLAQRGVDGTGSVSSVNGIFPDEEGNVPLNIPKGTVTSVNGESPDEQGNVALNLTKGTVKSVNDVLPNDAGLVLLDAEHVPTNYTKTSGYLSDVDYTFLQLDRTAVDNALKLGIDAGATYFTIINAYTDETKTTVKPVWLFSKEELIFVEGDGNIYNTTGPTTAFPNYASGRPLGPKNKAYFESSTISGNATVMPYESTYLKVLVSDLYRISIQEKLEELGLAEGTVKSVNGELPDENGNVQLTELDNKANGFLLAIPEDDFLSIRQSGFYTVDANLNSSFFPKPDDYFATYSAMLVIAGQKGSYENIITRSIIAMERVSGDDGTVSAYPTVSRYQVFDKFTGYVYEDSGWEQLGAGGGSAVTKEDIGLGNVDNTSDVDKPVSTAQKAAIDAAAKTVNDALKSTIITSRIDSSGNSVPDPNTCTDVIFYTSHADVQNPGESGETWFVEQRFLDSQLSTSTRVQVAKKTNGTVPDMKIRHYSNSVWSDWSPSLQSESGGGSGEAIPGEVTKIVQLAGTSPNFTASIGTEDMKMYLVGSIANTVKGDQVKINGKPVYKEGAGATYAKFEASKSYYLWYYAAWGCYFVKNNEVTAADIDAWNRASMSVSALNEDVQGIYNDIDTLFTSVSDGKAAVANAVTQKGVPTAADAEFATMAANIGQIKGSTGDALAGHVLAGKTFSNATGTGLTGTIPSLTSRTWTPTTSSQTIASGNFLSGAQTILGSPYLLPENIVSGKTIFGVTGTAQTGRRFIAGSATTQAYAAVINVSSFGYLPLAVRLEFTDGTKVFWTPYLQYSPYLTSANNAGTYLTTYSGGILNVNVPYGAGTSFNYYAWE